MFTIRVDYPSAAEGRQIVRQATGGPTPRPRAVIGGDEKLHLQTAVRRVPRAEHI